MWINYLRDYINTRLPLRHYIPLSLFLTNAALATSQNTSIMVWFLSTAFSFLLVFQFRLWDDLSDLTQDRKEHPKRTLCQAENITTFNILLLSLFILNLNITLWYLTDITKSAGLLCLCLMLLAWYHWRPANSTHRLLNSSVILIKYPAIVWLISDKWTFENVMLLVACIVAVYLIFIFYEITHDEKYRGDKNFIRTLALSTTGLVSMWLVMALWDSSNTSYIMWLLWAIVLLGTIFLANNHIPNKKQSHSMQKPYGIFLIGFIAFLGLAWKNNL